MTEPILKVRNLQAKYGNKIILKDISFDVMKNEIFVILGGSGCGKSTLLKNLIRLYKPSKGQVLFQNQNIATIDSDNLEFYYSKIGVLFQNGALLNSFTIFENVAIPLYIHTNLPYEIIKKIVLKKLELVDILHAAELLPSQLSGGMQKRAALARAIILDPDILFCDEPSAGLDPITAESLDQLFIKLKTQLNMTLIIVTHELASIKRIADHILFLDKGNAIFYGTMDEALNSNVTFVKNFFSKGMGVYF